MKIIFILGKYNPSRCGISDYVDLLSKEIQKHGHQVKIQSFNSKEELSCLLTTLEKADLYSIQFAPYSFFINGFNKKTSLNLERFFANKKVHINFHEIWIGAYPYSSWKEKYIGWRQKSQIRKFISKINPKSLTCTNSAAFDRLSMANFDVEYLYLFGNIPFINNELNKNSKDLRIAFFGTLYEKFPYKFLVSKLVEISNYSKRNLEIMIMGRQRQKTGLQKLKKFSHIHKFLISETKELPANDISIKLQNCDFGVSTTPYDIIGKSGATTAMLEHGLPIVAYDDGDTPKQKLFVMNRFKDQIFLLNENLMSDRIIAFMQKPRKTFFAGIPYTAKKMLELTL